MKNCIDKTKLKINLLKNEYRCGLMPDELLVYFVKNFHDIHISKYKKSLTVYNKPKYTDKCIRISDYWRLTNTKVINKDGSEYIHDNTKKTISVGEYDLKTQTYVIFKSYEKLEKYRISKFLLETVRYEHDLEFIKSKYFDNPELLEISLKSRISRHENIINNSNKNIINLYTKNNG